MPIDRKRKMLSCQSYFWPVVSLLFGVSLTTDVIYIFKLGNTCVYIGYAFAVVLALLLLVSRRHFDDVRLAVVDCSVWVFSAFVSLSLFPALFSAFLGHSPADAPLVVLKGLVVFFCGLLVYFAVAELRSFRRYFIFGLTLGLVINGIVSIMQQFAFDSGSFFTFYNLFPQDSFCVSAKWDIWPSLPPYAGRINTFRPQGLFLEASHLMVFLVCLAPYIFLKTNNFYVKLVIVVLTGYCAFTSASPNAVFLIIESLVLLAISFSSSSVKLSKVKFNPIAAIVLSAFFFAGILFLLYRPDLLTGAFESVSRSLSDLNVASSTDDGTLERWDSMMKALAALSQFPFGSGWNTESSVLVYIYGSSDVASHSFAIRLVLELGVLGLVSYIYVIVRHARLLLCSRSSIEALALGMAVVFLFVCQASNGTSMLPWVWALLGLAQSETLALKEGVRLEK